MSRASEQLEHIADELRRHAFSFADERQLHAGIAAVLFCAGIQYRREVVAGPRDRFDFLCDAGVVIEAKIKGSFSPALRQVDRYARREDVSAVLLVTTRSWGRQAEWATAELHGKPARTIRLGVQAF